MYKKNDNVESPCNDICTLDDEKICLGCFRSLDEIIHWQEMDDTIRRDVLRKAEKRRKAADE
jgi:hypothetical protein